MARLFEWLVLGLGFFLLFWAVVFNVHPYAWSDDRGLATQISGDATPFCAGLAWGALLAGSGVLLGLILKRSRQRPVITLTAAVLVGLSAARLGWLGALLATAVVAGG